MKITLTNSSRRYFLQRIAIASTALVALPTVLLAKNSAKSLRFAILGEDSGVADVIDKSDKMRFIDDVKFADVIYVSKSHQKSQKYIQEVLIFGKHLIIEDHENNEFLIENYQKSGSSLTVIKRSSDDSTLFENADYYEGNISKVIDFQKVINVFAFLEQNTKPLNFKIKSEHQLVEMSIS